MVTSLKVIYSHIKLTWSAYQEHTCKMHCQGTIMTHGGRIITYQNSNSVGPRPDHDLSREDQGIYMYGAATDLPRPKHHLPMFNTVKSGRYRIRCGHISVKSCHSHVKLETNHTCINYSASPEHIWKMVVLAFSMEMMFCSMRHQTVLIHKLI